MPGRDLGQLRLRGEVAQRVLVEQRPVLRARLLAKAPATRALVALYPLAGVLVQRDPRALLELAATDVGRSRGLRSARLVERAAGLPALLAVHAIGEHVPAAALVDARRACLLHLCRHQLLPPRPRGRSCVARGGDVDCQPGGGITGSTRPLGWSARAGKSTCLLIRVTSPARVQLGDGVHDLQAVALLADHSSTVHGRSSANSEDRTPCGWWCSWSSFGWRPREDCSGRGSQAGRLLAWLARREFRSRCHGARRSYPRGRQLETVTELAKPRPSSLILRRHRASSRAMTRTDLPAERRTHLPKRSIEDPGQELDERLRQMDPMRDILAVIKRATAYVFGRRAGSSSKGSCERSTSDLQQLAKAIDEQERQANE